MSRDLSSLPNPGPDSPSSKLGLEGQKNNGALVMDDVKRTFFSAPKRVQELNNHRHLQTDQRSVTAGASAPVARPFISLKARMLGGQAETITRLRGFMR